MKTILTGWKQIAAYAGKGVQTVQCWEEQFGLAIRRPAERDIMLSSLCPIRLMHG